MNWSPVASPTSTSRFALSRGGWLVLAGIFHVTITLLVFVLGRAKLLPQVFDSNGVGRYASDSPIYLADTINLVNQLKQAGIASWAAASFPPHTKLYSLSFAALGPLVGFNILAAEPINLLCYLAILFLVFKLGNEVSGPRTGWYAAICVALWPTFLLHTSQLLKDPLYIAIWLGLILVSASWLTKSLSPIPGLGAGILAGVLASLLWLIRADQFALTLLVIFLSAGFQCFRFIQTKRIVSGNLIGGITLLVIALVVPVLGPPLLNPHRNPGAHPLLKSTSGASEVDIAEAAKKLPVKPPTSSNPLTRLRERIAWLRYLFSNYPGTSSNIDADVRMQSWGEVIRYLPRAAAAGLLAPFPNMWLTSGAQVGRLGRMLSGLETLIMYFLMVLGLWGILKKSDQLAMWFLLTIATLSLIVLGLVVSNIGALYRMRYPFWILLIIAGLDGALRLGAREKSSATLARGKGRLAGKTATDPGAA